MWTPEMVLEAYLLDPNVQLTKRQRVLLEEILERSGSGDVELEIVSNPDALPGVLVCYTDLDDLEDDSPKLYFVEMPFENDEETIKHILNDSQKAVKPTIWIHPLDVYKATQRHLERGIISIYIGDYFLVPLVARENGNRILERLPEERKKKAKKRMIWFDDQITLLTLRHQLDKALQEKDFERCKVIKEKIDTLTPKENS